MGLFSFLGNMVGKAVEKAGDVIGGVTGWYGASSAGMLIQDLFSGNIAKESSYDKDAADVFTTERLNEILVSFSEGNLRQCEKLEEQCIREVQKYCNALTGLVRKSPGFTEYASSLKRVERSLSRIHGMITGSVKEPLAKRMSLDDSECLRILKMDSGEKKEEEIRKFSRKIINEALDNLGRKVREAIREQTGELEEFFRNYMEQQEKKTAAAKRQYDAMLQEGALEEADIEKNTMEPQIILKTAELIENML